MKALCRTALVVSIFLLPRCIPAATIQVDIQNFAFSPANITINQGDTVVWKNLDGVTHTSTSGNSCPGGGVLWDSGNLTNGQTFQRTFNDSPASYSYHCNFHCGMTGSVTVNAPAPDYEVACSPTTVFAAQGSSGNTTCTITSINGFNGPVTLSTSGLPAGASAGLSMNPVTPPANGSVNTTLTLNVGGSVTPGSYPVQVSGSGTPGTRSTNITLSVTLGPDFSVECSPSSWILVPGDSDLVTCTVSSIGGFSADVDMDCSGLPAGATCMFSSDPVQPPSGSSATTDVTVSADASIVPGSYSFQVTGSSTPGTRAFNSQLKVRDFTLSSSTASFIAPPGGGAGGMITIYGIAGFTDPVDMNCTGLPPGATCDFSQAQVIPSPGGSATTLTVNVDGSVTEATYPFQVAGTSGSLVHNYDISLVVTTAQEFSLSCLPDSLAGNRNGQTQTTCALSSINSYNEAISLGCSGLPAEINCDFLPNPTTPPQNGSAESALTILIGPDVPIGSYPFQVDASDGSLNHSASLILDVVPLYADDFDDADNALWTFKKGTWMSPAGVLVGTAVKKTSAFAPHTMCSGCTVELDVATSGGDGAIVSVYGWYVNSRNYVELLIKEDKDRWILKQKVDGDRLVKAKVAMTTIPATMYHVALTYDGSQFQVFVDQVLVLTSPAAPAPAPGAPGMKVKAATGTFDNVIAYE